MKWTSKALAIACAISALLFVMSSGKSAVAAEKTTIKVSAAMSLTDALNALKGIYAKKEPKVELQFNFAASGILQKQIEEGAPVDLFLSAGKKQMDDLAAKGLIIPQTRVDLLGNELVLVVAKEKKGKIRNFSDLEKEAKSISIGQPESVPAGRYAKETLVSMKLWDALKKRMIFAKDVRQVLAYVDSGNVDAGLVYRTDAIQAKNAVLVATAPKGSHSPIVYPMSAIKSGKNQEATNKFMAFLQTKEAERVFAKYKFIHLAVKK
jgi:molybdate transport system substrate-binding protein